MKILTALLVIVTFTQCKSKKEINNTKSPEMMSAQENVQLNPSQALILVKPKNLLMKEDNQVLEAEFIKLEKQSFGFNAYLNKGDIVSILVKDGLQINLDQEYLLVVEENGPAIGNSQFLKFIEVIK